MDHDAPPPAGHPAPTVRGRPRRLKARTPEDLLAFVPLALGFVPEESIVVVAVGCRGPHARVDLPLDLAGAREIGRALGATVSRHGVERVAVIAYCADLAGDPEGLARTQAQVREVAREVSAQGPGVVETLVAGPRHWWSVAAPDDPADGAANGADSGSGSGSGSDLGEARPYDAAAHPFRVQAVVDGLVVHGSRGELMARCAPDPALVAATTRVLRCAERPRFCSPADEYGPVLQVMAERGTGLSPQERARLLRWSEEVRFADLALRQAHVDAAAHLDLWLSVLRGTPPAREARVARLMALVAWLAGNGALAWAGLDRASECEQQGRGDPATRSLHWGLEEQLIRGDRSG